MNKWKNYCKATRKKNCKTDINEKLKSINIPCKIKCLKIKEKFEGKEESRNEVKICFKEDE